MDIRYANRKIEVVCTNAQAALKAHGQAMAQKIHMRIDQLQAADSIDDLIQCHIGKCHKLKGDREGLCCCLKDYKTLKNLTNRFFNIFFWWDSI
ncbi:MAG: hypothetical protein IJU79_04920 [Desulfovibrionaceae bacterium]|nr:hypothetical protein [Desulfovibrionaceae bacterium]